MAEISVKKFNWVSENYGISGYYEFEIEYGKCTIIKRRFSEIEWLNKMLIVTAAGCKLPELPEKSLFTNFYYHDIKLIEERKRQIDSYLKYIFQHEHLSQNTYFTTFLDVNFESERKEIQSKRSILGSIVGIISPSYNQAPLLYSERIYENEDKNQIERLSKGVSSILETTKEYREIYRQKNDALEQIEKLSSNIFNYNSMNSTLIGMDKDNQTENEKIFKTNNSLLSSIRKKLNDYINKMDMTIDELSKYKAEVEAVEKIFKRIEDFNKMDDYKLSEYGSNINRAKLVEDFKNQLKNELEKFKKDHEEKIMELIQKSYDEKINYCKNIKSVFDTLS